MSPSTKALFDAWMSSVDLKTMIMDHYRTQLGVDDLSTIPMVSIDELMANKSGGPVAAIDERGNLIYESSPFVYRFKKQPGDSGV